MPSKLSVAESHVLESIQNAAFDVPGVVPAARGLSHLGEHALGWMGTSALMYAVNRADKARRRQWAYVGASAFTAHAASVVLKRIVRRKRPDYPYVRVGVGTRQAVVSLFPLDVDNRVPRGRRTPNRQSVAAPWCACDDGFAYGARSALSNGYRGWSCDRCSHRRGINPL